MILQNGLTNTKLTVTPDFYIFVHPTKHPMISEKVWYFLRRIWWSVRRTKLKGGLLEYLRSEVEESFEECDNQIWNFNLSNTKRSDEKGLKRQYLWILGNTWLIRLTIKILLFFFLLLKRLGVNTLKIGGDSLKNGWLHFFIEYKSWLQYFLSPFHSL